MLVYLYQEIPDDFTIKSILPKGYVESPVIVWRDFVVDVENKTFNGTIQVRIISLPVALRLYNVHELTRNTIQ